MDEKSKWQREFEALPDWAQKMVRAVSTCVSYGGGSRDMLIGCTDPERFSVFALALANEADADWFDGFCDMKELADAIAAPRPPPPPPLPIREKRAFNLVEMVTDGDEDCVFDQPCVFGHRVNGHAVYCHNEAWPNSPRKCRRNRDDYLHEDCPGYVPNPAAAPPLPVNKQE